jgi:hypothetical protein
VASVRARYWNDALKIFQERPWVGVGNGGYRYARLRIRTDSLDVVHAHGYVVQVLAERGIVGMLVSLAALVALGWAVFRATGLGRRRGEKPATTPERVGLLTLTTMLLIFGISSFVDWTWFVPGVAVPVLLAGGWLANRGTLEVPPRAPRRMLERLREGMQSRERTFAAAGAIALAVIASWTAWQPQRSTDQVNKAVEQLRGDQTQIATARKLAQNAEQTNPLSVDPLYARAAIERRAHQPDLGLQALEEAVALQPANPSTWTSLAEYELHERQNPEGAKRTLSAALYLDPKSVQAIQLLIETNRALAAAGATATP